MTTKQIDYCIGLAHTLNFSRAADNMFVSQPTFSYQIRLLQKTEGKQWDGPFVSVPLFTLT